MTSGDGNLFELGGETPEGHAEPLGPPRRAVRPLTGMVSAAGAVVVHILLLAGLAAVVWRTTSTGVSGPDIAIDFESPALGHAAAPQPGPVDVPLPQRPEPAEVELVLAPTEAAPVDRVDVPALPSLASHQSLPAEGVRSEARGPEHGLPFVAASSAAGAGRVAAEAADRTGAGGVTFAGLGASNARSVVYAIDASGSMVTSLPFVIAEVERSVSGLASTQKFGVVLFREAPRGVRSEITAVEVFAPGLVRATPSARERLREWLAGIEPAGRSVPLAGLERAVDYKPDAIFLLSRSIERSGGNVWQRGLADTLARVDAINPEIGGGRRACVIQTIQFLDDDPTGVMQEIGRLHGSHTDSAGRQIAGYRVIRRGEELNRSEKAR